MPNGQTEEPAQKALWVVAGRCYARRQPVHCLQRNAKAGLPNLFTICIDEFKKCWVCNIIVEQK